MHRGDAGGQKKPPLDKQALARLDEIAERFAELRAEALLANPLMDFDRLLLVKRSERNLGLPTNYQSNSSLKPTGYDNEIAVLSLAGGEALSHGQAVAVGMAVVFRIAADVFVDCTGDGRLGLEAGYTYWLGFDITEDYGGIYGSLGVQVRY